MANPVDAEAAHSVLLLGSTTDLGSLRTHNAVQQRQTQYVDAARRLLQSETMINMLQEAGVELPSLEDLEMGKRRGAANGRGDWRSMLNKNHGHPAGTPDASDTGDRQPVTTPEGAPPSSTATPLAAPGTSPPRSPRRSVGRGGWRQHVNRETGETYEKNPVVRRLKKLRHKVLYGKVGEKAYARYKATLRADLTWRDILRPNLAAAKRGGHNQPGFSRWLDTAITEEQRRAVRDDAARVIQAAWRIFKRFRVNDVLRHVRNFELGKYNWSDDDSVATDELPDWWGGSSEEEASEGGEDDKEGGKKKKKGKKKGNNNGATLKRTPSMVRKKSILAQVAGAMDESTMGDAVVEGAAKRKKKKKKKAGGQDGGEGGDGEEGGEEGFEGGGEEGEPLEGVEEAATEEAGGGKGKKGKGKKGKGRKSVVEEGCDEGGDGGEEGEGGGEGDDGAGGSAKKPKNGRRRNSKRITSNNAMEELAVDMDDLLSGLSGSGQVLEVQVSQLSETDHQEEASEPPEPPPPPPPKPAPPEPPPSVPPQPKVVTMVTPPKLTLPPPVPPLPPPAEPTPKKKKKGKKGAKGEAGDAASSAVSAEPSHQDLQPADVKPQEPPSPPPPRRENPSPPPPPSKEPSVPPAPSASASTISHPASLSPNPSASDVGALPGKQRRSIDGRRGTAWKTTGSDAEDEEEEEEEEVEEEGGEEGSRTRVKKKVKRKKKKKPEQLETPRAATRAFDTPDWSKVGPSAALFDVKTDPERRAALLARLARDGGPNWRPPGVVADWYHMSQYLYDGDDPDKRAAAMAKVAETMAANGQPLWRHAGVTAASHYFSMSRSLYDGDDPRKRAEALAKAVSAPMNPLWRPPGIGPGIGPPKYDSGLFDGESAKETPRPLDPDLPPWKPPGVPRIEYYNYYSTAPSSSSNSNSNSGEEPESEAVPDETPEERAQRRAERRAARRAARAVGLPLGEDSNGNLGARINGRQPWRFTYTVEDEMMIPGNDPAQVRYDNITRDDKGAPRPWKYTVIADPGRTVPYNIWGPYVDPGSTSQRGPRSESLLAQATRKLAESTVASARSRSGVPSQINSPRVPSAAAAAIADGDGGCPSASGSAAGAAATSTGLPNASVTATAASSATVSASGASGATSAAGAVAPGSSLAVLPFAADTDPACGADGGPSVSDFDSTSFGVGGWGSGSPAPQPAAAARSPRPKLRAEAQLRRNMSFPRVDMHMPSPRRTHSARYRTAAQTIAVIPSHIVLAPEVAAVAEAVASLIAVSTNDVDSAAALRGLPYELSVMGRPAILSPTRVSPTGYASSEEGSGGGGEASFDDDDDGRVGPRHHRLYPPGHPLRARASPLRRSQAKDTEVGGRNGSSSGGGGGGAAVGTDTAAVGSGEASGVQGVLDAEGSRASAGLPSPTHAAVESAAAALDVSYPASVAAGESTLSGEASAALGLPGQLSHQAIQAMTPQDGALAVGPEVSEGATAYPGGMAPADGAASQLPPFTEPSGLAPPSSSYGRAYGSSWHASEGGLSYAFSSRRRLRQRSRRMSDETGGGMYGRAAARRERDMPRLYPPALSATAELVVPKRICSARRRGAFTTTGIQPYPLDPELLKCLPGHLLVTNGRARSAPGSPRGGLLANDDSSTLGIGTGGIGGGAGGAEASGMPGMGTEVYGYVYGEGDSGAGAGASGGGGGLAAVGSQASAVLSREDLPPLPAILQDPRAQEFFTTRGARITTQRRLAAKGSAQPDPRAMYELLFMARSVQHSQHEPYSAAAAAAAAMAGGPPALHSPMRRAPAAALADAHVRAQAKLGSPAPQSYITSRTYHNAGVDPIPYGPAGFGGQATSSRSSLPYVGPVPPPAEGLDVPSPGMVAAAAAAAAAAGLLVPPATPMSAWSSIALERGMWSSGALPLYQSTSQSRTGSGLVVPMTPPPGSHPHTPQKLQLLQLQQQQQQQQQQQKLPQQQSGVGAAFRMARSGSLPPLPQVLAGAAAAGASSPQLLLPPLPAGMHPSADLLRRSTPPSSSLATAAASTLLTHAQYTISVPSPPGGAAGAGIEPGLSASASASADGLSGARRTSSMEALGGGGGGGGGGAGGSQGPEAPVNRCSSGSGRVLQQVLAPVQPPSRSGSRPGSRESAARAGPGQEVHTASGGQEGAEEDGAAGSGGGSGTGAASEPAAAGLGDPLLWTALPPIPVSLQLPTPPAYVLQQQQHLQPGAEQQPQQPQQLLAAPPPSSPASSQKLQKTMSFQHIYMSAQHQLPGSPQTAARGRRVSNVTVTRQSTAPSAASVGAAWAAASRPGDRTPTGTTTTRLPAVSQRRPGPQLTPSGSDAASSVGAVAVADDGTAQRRKLKGQLRVGRAPLGPPLASRVPERPPGAAS